MLPESDLPFASFHAKLSERFEDYQLEQAIIQALARRDSTITYGELGALAERKADLLPEDALSQEIFLRVARQGIAQVRRLAFVLFMNQFNPQGYTLAPDPKHLTNPTEIVRWVQDKDRLDQLRQQVGQ